MRTLRYLIVYVVGAFAAFGQAPATALHFEAADVHSSSVSSPTSQFVRGPFLNGTRYDLRGATIVDLIVRAYDVTADKVVEGPNWVEYDRFDITATMPPKTSAADAKLMLQTLLTDRFGLAIRREEKSLPAYVLTTQKGKHKLKEATGSADTGCKSSFDQPRPAPPVPGEQPAADFRMAAPVISYVCRNMTMAAFAEGMKGMLLAQQFIGTNPVADKTAVEGKWDFDMKYTLPVGDGDNITLQDALEKQLGLKLEQETTTLPVLVVAKANRPTPNEPDVTQKIPPLPTEFEVATIRPFVLPSNQGGVGVPLRFGMNPQPGGRLEITGLSLKNLVQQAWGALQADSIVDAPKWMDTDRYTIVAKMPGDDAQRAPNTSIDPEYISGMLRKLLAERFKLAAHMEERSLPAYTLTAAKPKLKKSVDPSARVKWSDANGPIMLNGSSVPSRTTKFQNMSMAQFAEKLQVLASSYFRAPVVDATGLEGGYDFTLTFSPISPAMLAGLTTGRGAAPSGGAPAANDPIGGVSLFDAVEKQLGLKLVEQKRPVPVLVIDHVEQQPTEN